MQKDKKVELQKICYDVKLNPDTEEKLRDGLFNMETIRFGKIPEIMIKKMTNKNFLFGIQKVGLKLPSHSQ